MAVTLTALAMACSTNHQAMTDAGGSGQVGSAGSGTSTTLDCQSYTVQTGSGATLASTTTYYATLDVGPPTSFPNVRVLLCDPTNISNTVCPAGATCSGVAPENASCILQVGGEFTTDGKLFISCGLSIVSGGTTGGTVWRSVTVLH